MTGPSDPPDGWQRLWETFHAALDRDPSERAAFLDAACEDDAKLRAEIGELLAAHASDGILDQPVTPDQPARPAFAAGDVLAGRFRIVRLIGSGGMGTVYEARDEELGNSIAVKTLHPEMAQNTEALERFRREVLLARRVTHPNACRLFDLIHHRDAAGAVAFLTMELLRGETLAERLARTGPLSERDAYPIVEQVASALAAAHCVGVVHRDLKSANVVLVPAGDGEPTARAVVTDFGLASLMSATTATGVGLTRTGQLLGTPAFMAPEQLEGQVATAATDIYALGLVMYEMVTGAVPFARESALTLALKRLREPSPPPRVSQPNLRPEWNATIMRCLEREPADRFQAPDAVVGALRRGSSMAGVFIPRRVRRRALTASVAAGIAMTLAGLVIWLAPQVPSNDAAAMLGLMESPVGASSIAVLPFTLIGGEDADRQLPAKLAAGVTRKLEARGLTLRLAGADEGLAAQSRDPLARGRSLGANFVLEGRLIRYGERIQGLAQLLDTDEGAPRWAHRFEYSPADLAAAEDALVNRIARTIDAARSDTKLTDARSTAREAYEKGRYFWRNRTSVGLDRAISYFAQAIAADPTYGPGHAGLAAAYAFDIGHWPQAEVSARKALELDATLSDAHAVLGFIRMFWQWRWDEARVEFTRAVALDRQNATARQWYAIWLASTDRQMEALAEMTEALRLDPFSSIIRADLAQIQSFGGRYTQAIELCRQTLEADPTFVSALLYLYDFYTQTGRYDEAVDAYGRASEILENHPTYNRARVPLLRRAYETGGVRGFWRAILGAPKQQVDSYVAAEHFARLGEIDQALGALGKAYDTRHFGLVYLRVNPAFNNMREHPGFQRLIRRIGIPPLGIPHGGG